MLEWGWFQKCHISSEMNSRVPGQLEKILLPRFKLMETLQLLFANISN